VTPPLTPPLSPPLPVVGGGVGLGAGVVGAGVLGAGVLGAGVLGAGVLGVLAAGFFGFAFFFFGTDFSAGSAPEALTPAEIATAGNSIARVPWPAWAVPPPPEAFPIPKAMPNAAMTATSAMAI
jgi:hypothetical protein